MIGEFIGEVIGEFIFWKFLNFVGGTIRWIYGTIWRTIANRPKFKFHEYIKGPDKPKNEFDSSHGCVNIVIGLLAIAGIVIGLVCL